MDVRVMSSNILFDKTLQDRLPLIADYYRASDADLIGMQEVNRVGTALFETLADLYLLLRRKLHRVHPRYRPQLQQRLLHRLRRSRSQCRLR